jgi:hypothetical protein
VGIFDQVIDEGANPVRQGLTTEADRVPIGLPERMLRENGAQRVCEHRVFTNYARQCGETTPDTCPRIRMISDLVSILLYSSAMDDARER